MKIADIISNSSKPRLYEIGNSVMWTDSHISRQLLDVHLNSEIDLASRKTKTIKKTVEWILGSTDLKNLNILDLVCGPGLYSALLAKEGHKVTGVDFSSHSIEYAKKEAEMKNLDIRYLNENYLELELEENMNVYRFWTHFYAHSDLSKILNDHGYNNFSFYEDVLPQGDLWSGDNVTFCKAFNGK